MSNIIESLIFGHRSRIVASSKGFTISWANVKCAEKYYVYVYNTADPEGPIDNAIVMASDNNYYTFIVPTWELNIAIETYYKIYVSAYNKYGYSAETNTTIDAIDSYTFVFKPYSYVGNNWYATAMNTYFKIQDNSVATNFNPHAWVCWDFYSNSCGTLPWDAGEQWAWIQQTNVDYVDCDALMIDCDDVYVTFKQMEPGHIMDHIYTAEGHYAIWYCEIENEGFSIPLSNHYWLGANIVDCGKTRTETDVQNSVNYDWGSGGHAYFSGSYVLKNLSNISNYNKMKLILSACNSVELESGGYPCPNRRR